MRPMNLSASSMTSRRSCESPVDAGHPADCLRERDAAQRLARRLVGSTIPALLLVGTRGEDAALDRLASRSLVLYLYPGASSSPDGGDDSLLTDATQHRAFRERLSELANRRFVVLGLSSETPEAQLVSAVAQRLSHVLLSDPRLLLADAMGLPTVTVAGARLYRRLTIVVHRGQIGHVFFPVANVQRSADQVLTWAKVNGL